MKKTVFALLIAAISFVSCQKSVEPVDNVPEQQDPVTPHYVLSVPSSLLATKALNLDEETNTIDAIWGEEDIVLVYKKGIYDAIGYLAPANPGSSQCVLEGSINCELAENEELELYLHGELYYDYQLGTFDFISDFYDYAVAKVSVASSSVDPESGNILISTSNANFENQQAIVKFTLLDSAGNPLSNISRLTISAAHQKLVSYYLNGVCNYGDIRVVPDIGETVLPGNEIFVSLRNELQAADTYALTALTSSGTYTYIRSNVNFEYGKYYNITVKLGKENDVYTVVGGETGSSSNSSIFNTFWDASNTDNDMVKQADGKYRIKYEVPNFSDLSFKVVKNHSFDNGSWPADNYTIKASGNLVITFDPSSESVNAYLDPHVYILAGDESLFGNNWSMTDYTKYMELMPNGYYSRVFYQISQGTYNYKVVRDYTTWMQSGDNLWFTVSEKDVQNELVDFRFFYDPETNSAPVYPESTIPFTLAGSNADIFGTTWDPSNANNDMETTDDIIYTKSYNVSHTGDYTFEYKIALNHAWGTNGNWDAAIGDGTANKSFTVTKSGVLTFTLNKVTRNITATLE